MFALAILGVSEPHCSRSDLCSRPIVPHIGPQPGRLGLAVAGSQHRNRRIIGVDFRPCQYMLPDLIDQRREQLTGRAYPSGQSGTIKVDSFPSVDLRLPIQRQVICELRHQHMRQQTRAGQTLIDRPRRSRCLDHLFAASASKLRPHMLNHLEAGRNAFQLLGYIFAKLTQGTAAIRTAVCAGGWVMTSRGRSSGNGLRGGRGRDLIGVRRTVAVFLNLALLPARSPVLPAETQAVPAHPSASRSCVPKIIRLYLSMTSFRCSISWPVRSGLACAVQATGCAARPPSSSMLRIERIEIR